MRGRGRATAKEKARTEEEGKEKANETARTEEQEGWAPAAAEGRDGLQKSSLHEKLPVKEPWWSSVSSIFPTTVPSTVVASKHQ